ncbi:hypothetical protein H9X57_09340 [Flavobacterium piscinae]|uniref:DUF6705 domain-containing protein n=1 Tax=Flavobacterium piscinae TaxID=2506424 RepID=A0A4Q1KV48_9FLAO|nr:DUF6705 family protein [Flavobacterium piscinae]MBC8883523.1 hypothetical protein [Flavobacterium piscinae]RXR34113.1 hypothetical protein EQG68_03500 [Flavobacterium piscinae]
MKNKLKYFIIIASIYSFTGEAQTIYPLENLFHSKENDIYYKDINFRLSKFIGTWVYNETVEGTQHYFRVSFYKKEKKNFGEEIKQTIYLDELVAHFEYKRNGITIYNTYPPFGLVFDEVLNSYNANGIRGSSLSKNNLNAITLMYDEPTLSCRRNKKASLDLIYIPPIQGQPAKLQWQVNRITYSILNCQDGSLRDTSDYQIPLNMVLTKQQ